MNELAKIWLGYARTGGRIFLSADDLKGSVCLLGQSSNELATTMAYSCHEAGLKTLVLDLDGSASDRISGHIPAYGPSYFLYDIMKTSETNPNFHAQLIASAYSAALDLSFEQEAILGNICQLLALETGVAGPTALAERMEGEDLAGNASKRLRARLNGLSSLNVVGETEVLSKLMQESAVLTFRESITLEIAELSAALVIAKLLALNWAGTKGPDVLVLLQANRLFRGRPIFRQNLRLLSTFVGCPIPRVLSSEPTYGLDQRFLDTSVIRILSSDVWNDQKHEQILAPSMHVLRNLVRGFDEAFVPRGFELKVGPVTSGSTSSQDGNNLTKEILEAVAGFQDPTRGSVTAFVSAGHAQADIEKEIDRLASEGYLSVELKDLHKGAPHSVLKLTTKGHDLFREGK